MIFKVIINKSIQKDLKKAPKEIIRKLTSWVEMIELMGLEEVRKIPGFHDEPLSGERKGQRSIRLNKAWRAIYRISGNEIKFVLVEEVNKHEY